MDYMISITYDTFTYYSVLNVLYIESHNDYYEVIGDTNTSLFINKDGSQIVVDCDGTVNYLGNDGIQLQLMV